MTRILGVVALAGMAMASAAGNDAVFHKSTTFDNHGKEHKVDLVFLSDQKAIVVREKAVLLANVPFDGIDKVSYDYAQRHRVREGVREIWGESYGLGVISGPIVMMTKEKKHWLYVDYHDPKGAHELTLRLDKSEYENILAVIKVQTGKDVQIPPPEGKQNKTGKDEKKNEPGAPAAPPS